MVAEKQPQVMVLSVQRSTLRAIAIVAICTLSMILNTASATVASIALPTIGRDLNIVQDKLQWIVSAFNLSSGCLLLLFGRIADLYGRKLVFLVGIAILGVFSLGAGFAQDEITIDILRGIQGIGGAAVIPASLGILAHSFPPSRARSVAFATFAAGAPMGGAIGLLIGGTLTQLTAPTWRSSFFLIAGLSLAALLGGLVIIDRDHIDPTIDRRVDWLGAFLVTTGLVLICFILSEGPIAPRGFKTNYIIALIVVGVVLLILFVLWQHYLEHVHETPQAANAQSIWTPPPLMKISIWGRSKGRMTVILVIAFFEWCSFMSWLFWAQLYYQNYLLLTPVLTMVRLLPMTVTGCLCNLAVALVVGRIRVVFLIVLGTAMTAAASLLFALINTSSPYWAFGFPASIISVFGADFVFASGTLFVAKISLPHEQSLAGALFQTMTQLGTSFGLAITTIIFNSTLDRRAKEIGIHVNTAGTNAPQFAQLDAYKAAMWGGFAFGILGSILAAVFLSSVGVVGHNAKTEAADEEKTRSEMSEATEGPLDREGEHSEKLETRSDIS